MPPDAVLQSGKPFWIAGRRLILIAHMRVHDARTRFKRGMRAFNLLGNTDWYGRIVFLPRQAASDGDADDARCAHSSGARTKSWMTL